MTILSSIGGSASRSFGLGKNIIVPGNSGILTSGSSFKLPETSGPKINVLVIGGGGGGGGGSGRRTNSGYSTGGGGGGAAGNAYVLSIPVKPGQDIAYVIGAGGSAGGGRDGVYSSGSNGGTGGSTSITINGSVVAQVSGGNGGLVSPNATAGSAGGLVTGTQILTPTAGSDAPSGTSAGGAGAKGYTINTLLSAASSLGYGASGIGYPHGSTAAIAGTIYGAGGSGGGTAQSDVEAYANVGANAGTTGAIVIWWG